MNELLVLSLGATDLPTDLSVVTAQFRKLPMHPLSIAAWKAFSYVPHVQFSIGYDSRHLYLFFDVQEQEIKASYGRTNDPVYKDSCVEFFVAFDDEGSYYNLEFNCIGTVLAGFGTGKSDRALLPDEVVKSIACQVVMTRRDDRAQAHWTLTVRVPFTAFCHHRVAGAAGMICRGNFYKCGDDLSEPHFLSWTRIESEEPNFHLPQFFGRLVFG